MRQRFLKICAAAFAPFFTGLSLLGPGWHAVFGNQFHGTSASCHSHLCGHTHHVPQDKASADHGPRDTESVVPLAELGEHVCPLCQFFGQAQLASALPTADGVVLLQIIDRRCESAPRLLHAGIYRSRAPPASALCS